jgi:hypothetical protein
LLILSTGIQLALLRGGSDAKAASTRFATNVAASEYFELMPLATDLE